LSEFDFLNRSQIQHLHDLKSERNANRFLNDMGEYLNKFRHGLEYVYHLNKAGADRIGAGKVRKRISNVDHFLLRNQLRIALHNPKTWENEIRVKIGSFSIVCDAKFMMNNIPAFVEVDVTQPMAANKAKIEKYKKLKEISNLPFNLIWVTAVESRRDKLRELMAGMTGRVYTLKDIQ